MPFEYRMRLGLGDVETAHGPCFVLPRDMVCLTDAFIYRPTHESTPCQGDFSSTRHVKAFPTGDTDDLSAAPIKSVWGEFPNLKLANVTIRRRHP
jgi:hypothetical protein